MLMILTRFKMIIIKIELIKNQNAENRPVLKNKLKNWIKKQTFGVWFSNCESGFSLVKNAA